MISNQPHKKTVLILGGGLAGLASAYELVDKGYLVTIVEKSDGLGGLARTIEKKGFKFDTGPHRWYTKSDMVNDWMLKLLGDEVVKIPRLTRIYFDHKFFYYPIRLKNAIAGIGPIKAGNAVIDYVIARLKARLIKQKLVTMEDGYINQFGKTLFETFFKRYSEKLWGQPCDKISVDWVGQRTRGLNISTILREMIVKSKKVVSLVDEFSYPKNGIGRLAEKMAEKVRKYGGKVLLFTDVTGFTRNNGLITSITVKTKSAPPKELTADFIISSIPLNEVALAIRPQLNNSIRILANKLNYRDELQVVLFLKKTHITPDTWIYVHPKEIPFMRLMEMDNWSNRMSPKGTTSMVFEIACNEGDSMWKRSDENLVKLVSDSFVKEFGLVSHEEILGGYVHRVPKEYPVYHVGYRTDVDKIKEKLKKITNLQLVGRNGTFRYNNMDHSIEMGLYAAWNLIAGKNKFNIESVNIEREYLEEKKIENLEDEQLELDNERH